MRCGALAKARAASPLRTANQPISLVLSALVDERRARLERGFGIHYCRQIFVVDRNQLRGVLRLGRRLGHHHRDRLADVACLVHREQRLPRVEDAVLDGRFPFAGQRQLVVAHRRQRRPQLAAVEHQHHARRLLRARLVDRADARMRQRAAHEHGVQHPRQLQVGDVLPPAAEQAVVFPPQHRLPDELRHPAFRCASRLA